MMAIQLPSQRSQNKNAIIPMSQNKYANICRIYSLTCMFTMINQMSPLYNIYRWRNILLLLPVLILLHIVAVVLSVPRYVKS